MKKKFKLVPSKKLHAILILIILSVLIVIAGYIYYTNEKTRLLKDQKKELETIAKLKIDRISEWYADELMDAGLISKSSMLTEYFSRYLAKRDKETERVLSKYLSVVKEEHSYSDIIIISRDQSVILSSGNNTVGIDSIMEEGIVQSTKSKSIVHLHLFRSSLISNGIFSGFVTPLFDFNNKQIGSLIFLFDAEKSLFTQVKFWPVESRTAESLIFRKEGNSVLFLNELKHLKNTALNLKLPISQKDLPASMGARGYKGIVEGKDYRGVRVYAYVDSIPGTDWYMVAKIDEDEMFEGMNDELIVIIFITILFIVLTGVLLSFLYSYRQRNIYRELYNKEKELLSLEERYRITVESLADGVITADTTGKVEYMNNAAEKLTGWTLKEAKGKTLHDIYFVKNELTGKPENNIAEKVLKYGVIKELANHTVLISKNGVEIPVSDAGAPIYDKDRGIVAGLVLTFQDETEKRNQKKLLEESEKRFRTSLDNMLEGCQIIDSEWRYVYLNDSAAKHGKADKKDLIGKTMMEAYPGIKNTEMFKTLKYCKENSVRKEIENTFIYPDGSKGWFELSIEPVFEGLFILSIDRTDKKLFEKALKESEEKYRELVENINEAIYIMNIGSGIEYISPAIEKLTGFIPEHFIGNKFIDFLKKQNLVNVLTELNEIEHGTRKLIDFNIYTKDGSKRWLRISGAPIVKDSKITGMRGVISDITEKIEYLTKLREAKEKAEEMNKLKSNFFANMSHELRTPFVGITGFAELLLEKCVDPDAKEMAEGILASSHRMQDTLAKILDLSKLEFKMSEPDIEQVEVKTLIDSITKQFEKAAQKKNLYLTSRTNFNRCLLKTDEKLLTSILNNLISNAIIYTNEGGVHISSVINKKEGRNILSISVIDTGIGIPKEKQEIVWSEFRQVSEGLNRHFQGTGLGLSITKKYCDLLGGKIFLQSEEGKGSIFTVELPFPESFDSEKEVVEELAQSAVPNEKYKQTYKKVLCIEDDETSVEVFKRALSKNYLVDTTGNALEAIDKIKKNKYDAILMDINLGPGLNGEELTQKVKLMPEYRAIPIIAVTAYASESDKNQFLSSGMDYYISKPFRIKDLLDLMEKVFANRA